MEDLLGNKCTRRYVFTVDDTPVSKPRVSLPSGSFYSSDIGILKCYFDEWPAIVIANWNNGTNQSLTIQSLPAMQFRISADAGSYYVIIELPTALFTTQKLTLYISDRAGNWVVFHYTYHKIASVTELIPLILFLTALLSAIFIWQRKPIGARLQRGVNTVKIQMKKDEYPSKTGEEKKQKTGDKF